MTKPKRSRFVGERCEEAAFGTTKEYLRPRFVFAPGTETPKRGALAASSRSQQPDYGQHDDTACKWHEETHTQAACVPRNHAYQRRHQRAPERRHCKHNSAYFPRAHAKPFGKPCNKNRKQACAAKACKKRTAKQPRRRMSRKKDKFARGREQ